MINYLCLDNEANESLRESLDLIQKQSIALDQSGKKKEQVSIKLEKPLAYDLQLDDLALRLDKGEIDGIILDLRLDDQIGDKAKYRAPTIAQELRTRSAEPLLDKALAAASGATLPQMRSCPLVLWSTDKKLADSYRRDDTSHDLFEFKIFKDKLAGPESRKEYAFHAARKLVASATGYRRIAEAPASSIERAEKLLALEQEWSELLDARLFAPLNEGIEQKSIHEQARYITRQLLETPNTALITPQVAAARLGVDPTQMSITEIEKLVDQLFPKARYKGAFAEGWPCWWTPKIEDAWLELNGVPGPLLRLPAETRVEFINRTFGTKFNAAERIKYATSSVFTTVCQVTGRPLASIDGFATSQHLFPWQLPEYVSLDGMLGKDPKREYPKLDPLEVQRFEEERKLHPETRRRK